MLDRAQDFTSCIDLSDYEHTLAEFRVGNAFLEPHQGKLVMPVGEGERECAWRVPAPDGRVLGFPWNKWNRGEVRVGEDLVPQPENYWTRLPQLAHHRFRHVRRYLFRCMVDIYSEFALSSSRLTPCRLLTTCLTFWLSLSNTAIAVSLRSCASFKRWLATNFGISPTN